MISAESASPKPASIPPPAVRLLCSPSIIFYGLRSQNTLTDWLTGSIHGPVNTNMDYEINAESEPKRRKIRKGTKSCWGCKKRKMKCVYANPSSPADADAICIGCQQRGSKCVSQEFEFVGGRENAGHLERKGRRHTGGKDYQESWPSWGSRITCN